MAIKIQNRSTKDDPIIEALPNACCDEVAAVEFMETQRWGASPSCPRCGSLNIYQMKDSKTGERQANFRWLCRDCKSAKANPQFTVRTGTVFEDSKIELRHWCFAFWRASTSKKGVSALEIHRQTGLSYKSSLFLLNRIRYAMAPSAKGPLKGDVEIDETFIGGKARNQKRSRKMGRGIDKHAVLAMVERGGRVISRPVPNVTGSTLKSVILEHVDTSSRIFTDEYHSYRKIGKEFAGGHETVCHSKGEYVRGIAGTNTIEGFFASVKRGLNGIYHAVSKEHLHRYLSEFEFRYNYRQLGDGARTVAAIKAAAGKRLTYRDSLQ